MIIINDGLDTNKDLINYYAKKFEKEIKSKIYRDKIGITTHEIVLGKTADTFMDEKGLRLNFDQEAKVNALNIVKKDGVINDFRVLRAEMRSLVAICDLPERKKQSPNDKIKSLSDRKIIFKESTSSIIVDDKFSIHLPPYKGEYCLAAILFQYEKNEPVDWSEIYEKITEIEIDITDKNATTIAKRKVADTMRRINKRIKNDLPTEDDLFNISNNTILRRF